MVPLLAVIEYKPSLIQKVMSPVAFAGSFALNSLHPFRTLSHMLHPDLHLKSPFS